MNRLQLTALLLALLVLGEALLFLFNPFSSVQQFNGIDAASIAFLSAAKLLFAVIISAVIALLFSNSLDPFFQKISSKKFLYAFIAIYIIVFSLLSFYDFFSYNAAPPDLYTFENIVWNTLNGRILFLDWHGMNFLGIHSSFILLLLVPFYALYQSPLTLLFIQTVLLALGAIPLYLIAKKFLNEKSAIVFSLAYLLYPALQFINLREFHESAFAVPLLLCVFYFLFEENWPAFWLSFALTLLVKETAPLALLFLGFYIFLKKDRIIGALASAASLIYFAAVIFFVIPFFRGAEYAFIASTQSSYYSHLGSTLGGVISTVVSNPFYVLSYMFLSFQKIGYLLLLFAPAAFLSLFDLPLLLVGIPVFAQNLLASDPRIATLFFQYNDYLIAVIFVSAILGLRNLLNLKQTFFFKNKFTANISERINRGLSAFNLAPAFFLSFLFLMAIFSNVFFSPSPLGLLDPARTQTQFSFEKYAVTEHTAILDRAVAMIPDGASVSADSLLTSHLAKRSEMEYFPGIIDSAEFVFVDQTIPAHASANEAAFVVEELKKSPLYKVLVDEDGVVLLERK
ncbi:MAG: DUF2079 domain-containing protein [Candidatus Diapherotrites archaeon]